MAHENERTRIAIKRFGDNGEMTKVDMIRRLIKDKEIRLFEEEFRKHKESLLPFGETLYLVLNKRGRQEKARRGFIDIFHAPAIHGRSK